MASALVLSGCFSAAPSRGGKSGQGIPPPPTTQTGGEQSSTSSRSSSESSESSSQQRRSRQARDSQSTQRGSGGGQDTASAESSESKRDREKDRDNERRDADDEEIRVATAGQPGTTGSSAGTTEPSGLPSGDQEQVGVEEALEAANAAVDAAADAVEKAEGTIERARDVAAQANADTPGGSGPDNFDPWVEPGSATADAGSEGGQGSKSDQTSTGTGGNGDERRDEDASGSGQGEENFDPFAVFEESGGASASRSSSGRPSEATLDAADGALATAQGALNRARRALIAASAAGGGDADAEAVQLAAAQAALEAAAEAVIASAIAVMAASASFEPEDGEPATAEEVQAAMENFAKGLAMVVDVLHKSMQDAGDALEATAELLTAAGQLIGMVGNANAEPTDPAEQPVSAGERVALLEEQLDSSLEVFDDRMHAEGSSIVPGMGSDDQEMSEAEAAAVAGSQDDAAPRRRGRAMAGSSAPIERDDGEWAERPARERSNTTTAENIDPFEARQLPAQDDDIVARQLREAAVAETDPELRERLWEEYYAYKESLESGEAESTQ